MNNLIRTIFLLALLLPMHALGAAKLEIEPYDTSMFRAFDKVQETCSTSSPSFLCGIEGSELTLIRTKGGDYHYTEAGEVAANFSKMQRGSVSGDFKIDANTNLVPFTAAYPAGAILINGEYHAPTNITGAWHEDTSGEIELLIGTFAYDAGDYHVNRTITMSATRDTAHHAIAVTALAGGDAEARVQFALPGIAKEERPTTKIGYSDTFVLDPPEQDFQNFTYAALQRNNKNSGEAFVLLPVDGTDELTATWVRPTGVAVGTTLESGSVAFEVNLYAGRNELVRYIQEGYIDLPGLFKPNIIGQLSRWVVAVLQIIHDYVPSWGLSIIVLTLLFRALVWPLITTQTKSMYGMQALNPKLQELQRKYKDNREKLQEEQIKLYKEAGVNPAGGCLPMLLQMPLFIILWRVFVNFEFNEGFLWLPDLGMSDPFYILPVLYVGVMTLTAYFTARGNPQQMRQSMIINLVFVVIIISFPAGVLVYYVTSMLVQVLQYALLAKHRPPTPPATGKKKPATAIAAKK